MPTYMESVDGKYYWSTLEKNSPVLLCLHVVTYVKTLYKPVTIHSKCVLSFKLSVSYHRQAKRKYMCVRAKFVIRSKTYYLPLSLNKSLLAITRSSHVPYSINKHGMY